MSTKNSNPKPQKIRWLDPIKMAHKIADNYSGNWVFLYSALHKFHKNCTSYIALFEKDKFCGTNFAEFQHKILQDKTGYKWFGGINYEVSEQFENFTKTLDSHINLEPIFFSKFALILEFNHHNKTLNLLCEDKELIQEFYNFIKSSKSKNPLSSSFKITNIKSNFSDNSYLKNIDLLKKMIANGDFFQANLTRKFFGEFSQALSQQQNFSIFVKLIKISPANYNFFANLDNKFIISSSPELYLECNNRNIRARPIKGSIHRGKNTKEDLENKNYLKNSLKEKAENLMIVDLMRNDFARFCEVGSVKVKKLFKISSYKTIHHLSSEIHGKISKKYSIFDALRASFPAGSMTGAPKIKAIEILKQLEKFNRGIYSGAFGIIAPNSLNLAVVIRTIIIEDNKFEFQVGGGITFDSDPHLELQETYTKIKGIMLGLGLAKDQMDYISGEDLQKL